MSDTSLGMPTAQQPSDDHAEYHLEDRRNTCGPFHQRLQRAAIYLLAGICLIGAAAVTTAITRPSAAVPAAAASIGVCVTTVAALLLWTIIRAPATSVRPQRVNKHHEPPSAETTTATWQGQPQMRIRSTSNGDGNSGTGRHHIVGAEPRNDVHPIGHDVDEPAATTDIAHRREVWVTLARRLQTLTYRAIKTIDGLENKIEDPEVLADIYKVDNLISLVRRKGENIAVLGGDPPQRRSNSPVELHKVLIASLSEIERFRQVAIVPTSSSVAVQGYVAAEVIHLLAELLENATQFTDPDGPKVEVRAHKVTAGLAIEIQDRGLGVEPETLQKINGMLDGTAKLDIADHLNAGQIGLAVVRELGLRNGVAVQLQTNIYGGVAAVVVLPKHLLVDPTLEAPSTPALPPAPVPAALPSSSSARPALTAADAAPSPTPRPPSAVPAGPRPPLPTRPSRTRAAASDAPREDQGAHWAPRPAPGAYPPGTYAPVPAPPPLPQRNNRSYMHPALNDPTAAPTAVPGHNTTLFADIRAGRDHWLSGQADAGEPEPTPEPNRPDTTHTQPEHTTRGQQWPMN